MMVGGFVQISLMCLRNTDGTQSVSPVFSFTKEETGVKEETKTSIWDSLPQGLREAFVLTSSYFYLHS